MSKKKANNVNIDTSAFGIMQDIKKKQESGEAVDEYTAEAIRSIEFASNVMDSLMSGKQLDLAFYRLYTKNAIKNLRRIDKKNGVKRTIKSRIEDEG